MFFPEPVDAAVNKADDTVNQCSARVVEGLKPLNRFKEQDHSNQQEEHHDFNAVADKTQSNLE